MNNSLYLFLDEGGNFDFKPSGTRYFTLTSVAMRRPFAAYDALNKLRYDCLEYGLPTEFFHCSEDNRHVRSKVFACLTSTQANMKIDTLVVDKSSVPADQQMDRQFYPHMLGRLLKEVIAHEEDDGLAHVIVITDSLPIQKKRQAVEKAIKQTLADVLPAHLHFHVLHHASRSHFGLQMADYCNWAIYRKWQSEDLTYYKHLQPAIRLEILQNASPQKN